MLLHNIEIETCILDVNGVLINSNLANAEAMAMAFTDDISLRKEIVGYYLTLTGMDRGTKIRLVQDKIFGIPFMEGEFEERWSLFKKYGKTAMQGARVSEDAINILEILKANNVTRAALSNTPLKELKEVLTIHGLLPHLDIARGGGDWPKSESLKNLLEELNATHAGCLFVGDGKGDLKAARENGITFAAIDPDTGEFDRESGFFGPYKDLKEWWNEAV